MISALAVVCVRNEAIHIRRCLSDLIDSGLLVHLIDNGSEDGTREIATSFLGHGLIAIDDLPWHGAFSLTDQLQAKKRIIAEAKQDWIIHCDADEWLMAPNKDQSLLDGIAEANDAGFTVVNFHEATFVAEPGDDFSQEDYAQRMTAYYFFQPSYPRLNRAWARNAGLDISSSGGHLLNGESIRIYPIDFILRHYIILSEAQGRAKYLARQFSNEDRAKHWHGNRLTITEHNLSVKKIPELLHLSHPTSRDFDFSKPVSRHFWEW